MQAHAYALDDCFALAVTSKVIWSDADPLSSRKFSKCSWVQQHFRHEYRPGQSCRKHTFTYYLQSSSQCLADTKFVATRKNCERMAAGIVGIISLAFALATGLLLLILACALENNWWPLFTLFFFLLAPAATYVGKRGCGGESDDFGGSSTGSDVGSFMTAVFVVSGLALPIVLQHSFVISSQAMALTIAGGICVYGATAAYIHLFAQDDSSF